MDIVEKVETIIKNDAEARVAKVVEQGFTKAEDLINFALKNKG